MPDPSFIIEDVDAGGSVFGTIARPSVTEIEVPLIQTTGSGGGGVSDHPSLTARDEPDQHPISAIEDLQDALDTKALAGWPDVTLCPIDELTDATDVDDYNRTRTFVFGRSDDAEIHSAVQLANPGDVHTAHGAASVVVVEQAGAMPGSVFWRDPTPVGAYLDLGPLTTAIFGQDLDYSGTPLVVTWELDGDEVITTLTDDYGVIGGGNIATFLTDLVTPLVAEGVTTDESFTLYSPTTGVLSSLTVDDATGPGSDPVVDALLVATGLPGAPGVCHGVDDAGMALGSEDYYPTDRIIGGGTHNAPTDSVAQASGTLLVAVPAIGDDPPKWSAVSHPTRINEISGLEAALDALEAEDIALDGRVTTLEGASGGSVATDTIWNVKGDLAIATAADTAVRVGVGSAGQAPTPDTTASSGVAWANPVALRNTILRPTGSITETFSRFSSISNQSILTSGRLLLTAVALPEGQLVTSITFVSATTAANTPTNQWFGLFNSSLEALRFTTDDTTAAWGSSTAKTLNLSSTYTTTYTGKFYLGIMVAASVAVPTLRGVTNSSGITYTDIVGLSTSSLTTPPSLPFTANALAIASGTPWAYCS
jgi:hypothetical protein